MSGFLFKEHVEDVAHVIVEDAGKGVKQYFIEGTFLQSEIKNRNGRIYPKNVLMNEAARYSKEYVEKNRAFGELGHPDNPTINLDRVSHMIVSLKPDGNNILGKAKILDTPNGKIVKNLLDGGAQLGVSTRGVGSLKPMNGYSLVQDDFRLATAADIVADPSAPDAFVRGLMENAEWIYENGKWSMRQFETAQKIVKEASRADIERVSLQLFENFLQKL